MTLEGVTWKDPTVKEALDNILDTMTGADGGISFIKFQALLLYLDSVAASDSPGEAGSRQASQQVLEVVRQFSRLINAAQK